METPSAHTRFVHGHFNTCHLHAQANRRPYDEDDSGYGLDLHKPLLQLSKG